MNEYDVVVVGGRVAGASTALLLALEGLRVAVVEREEVGRDTVSTHALMRAGVLQLARWGLLDQVREAGTPRIGHTMFGYPDGKRVTVSLRSSRGVDGLYAPRRTVLDRILIEAAEAAGAHVLRRNAVRLVPGPGDRVGGVVTLTEQGTEVPVRAAFTVGADGFRSTVARQAGAVTLRRGRSASALLYRYVHGMETAGYEWFYGRGAAAGLIPTNDDATCVFVSTTPEEMRALRTDGPEQAFQQLLGASDPGLADRLALSRGQGRLHGWKGAPARVRRPWGPGWALVGDAGCYKDPITTHGITDSLRDAELLAHAVVRTLDGGLQPARALATYQQTRDRLSRHLWDVTEEVAGYRWDADSVRVLLRNVSAAMSDEVNLLESLPFPHPLVRREQTLTTLTSVGTVAGRERTSPL
jgi:2-polyprenyl-6-methoxyphenol hydroxylase-like FAD-dependent oxidoreductase